AVLFHRFDEDLNAGDFDLTETDRDRAALFGADPSGAAIDDVAIGAEGAEITANRHVAGLQRKPDAGGFERPAADLVLQRVVTKQAEVPRAAARSDAGFYRNASPLHCSRRNAVKIRGV